MAVMRKRLCASLLVCLGIAAVAGPLWRVRAQNRTVDPHNAVQAVDPKAARPHVTNGDRGSTYHALENQAGKVTTRFVDAVAIGERTVDGRLSSRVTDAGGNDLSSLVVNHVDAVSDTLAFKLGDRPVLNAARLGGLRPTLDWNNQQAYSLWKDRSSAAGGLEWQDTLMRPRGARPRPQDWNALETRTEWNGGLSAVATRRRGPQVNVLTGKSTPSDVIVSHFYRDGVEMGVSYYYIADRLFAWYFPGLTEGSIDERRLQPVGGWPIAPDMGWVNTQDLAFYQFGTVLKQRGKVAKAADGWLRRIGRALAPTLSADDLGCDDLHWLDQTVFRYCCDQHDQCYSKYGCTSYSWWEWWSSWRCDACNFVVAFCFEAVGNLLYRFP